MEKTLEKMNDFFNKRAETYEFHMIDECGLAEFYEAFRKCIDETDEKLHFLDLGCGTGLEIEQVFKCCPNAEITGIDLSEKMLEVLKLKFPGKANQLNLMNESYFDVDFGINKYDYVISTYSLHHFTVEEKRLLYKRIFCSLNEAGTFIEGDYVVDCIEKERFHIDQNIKLREQNKLDSGFYHYDTPLFFQTQKQLLIDVGFKKVDVVRQWENTSIFVCRK